MILPHGNSHLTGKLNVARDCIFLGTFLISQLGLRVLPASMTLHCLIVHFILFSQTGKRLMAKCRMLLQENEELGKVISSGRTAKLEGEIALEKTLVQEMKKSQAGNSCQEILLAQVSLTFRETWLS